MMVPPSRGLCTDCRRARLTECLNRTHPHGFQHQTIKSTTSKRRVKHDEAESVDNTCAVAPSRTRKKVGSTPSIVHGWRPTPRRTIPTPTRSTARAATKDATRRDHRRMLSCWRCTRKTRNQTSYEIEAERHHDPEASRTAGPPPAQCRTRLLRSWRRRPCADRTGSA